MDETERERKMKRKNDRNVKKKTEWSRKKERMIMISKLWKKR